MSVLPESLRAAAHGDGVEKFVVGAVVHHGGAVLVVTRSELDEFSPGIDELPSGGAEVGESLAAALDRELLEESDSSLTQSMATSLNTSTTDPLRAD